MNFISERNSLGHLVIKDVPIFVECSRGETSFSQEWILQAVAKAKLAETEGYLPPLHVRHHGDNQPVRPAGFFRITKTESIRFKGKTKLAVFAELTITDPDVDSEVLTARLPYRSVEIFDVESPAIDSLALLDHEAPYLELPMLMVAEPWNEKQTPDAVVASATFRNPYHDLPVGSHQDMVACFRRGPSATIFLSGEATGNMSKTTTKSKMSKDSAEPAPSETTTAVVEMKDEGKDESESYDSKMADEALDVDRVCAAIASGEMSEEDMAAIMDSLMAAKGEEQAAGEDEVEVPVPGESMGARMAKLAGENDALKARMDERDQTETRRANVVEAMQRLDGRPMGSDVEDKLVKFHAEHGPAAFHAYVDSLVKTFAHIESSADDGVSARFSAQTNATSEVALTYTGKGAEAVEQAAQFSAIWKELSKRGHVRMDEQRYVELNMKNQASN